MQKTVITTTGFYKTGSTAVFELLKEYDSCTTGIIGDSEYEHLLLYTPNGLFDLEDKLLLGNNIHRSDEALRSFKMEMQRLNDNNFVWFGDYKKITNNKFMPLVEEFVESITDVKLNCNWSYDYLYTRFSVKHLLGSIKNVLLRRPVNGDFSKKIIFRNKKDTRYSYCTAEEFYKNAEEFFSNYCKLINNSPDKLLILDHCMLPGNVHRTDNYLKNLKTIIVDRDPRDVYMHVMKEIENGNFNSRIPYVVTEFVLFWKKFREISKTDQRENTLTIRYEDLFYKYDETVGKIEAFCGIEKSSHVKRYMYFNPDNANKYIQTFKNYSKYNKEINYIERELSEYLYEF